MCKGPVDPKELAVICRQAFNKTAIYPSLKSHCTERERQENDNLLTLQRILMHSCAFCEYGSTQMASCVLGHPAQYQSHDTILVFIKQALAFQDLMTTINTEASENNNDNLDGFIVSDSESLSFLWAVITPMCIPS